jgi:hypothetical protein
LLVAVNVHSSLILCILMMEAIRSSETSVLTRATWCYISEDGILYKNYTVSFSHSKIRVHMLLCVYTFLQPMFGEYLHLAKYACANM